MPSPAALLLRLVLLALLALVPASGLAAPAPRAEPILGTPLFAPPSRAVAPVSGGAGTVTASAPLVVDFGRLVSGKLEVDVTSIDPGATLRFSFSESREFLALGSDSLAYGYGDLKFTAQLVPVAYTAPLRRSFRWLMISLEGGQRAELGRTGLWFTPYFQERPRGSFESADPTLDGAWQASAYTVQVVTTTGTASECDGGWEPLRGALDVMGCRSWQETVSRTGADWTDYDLFLNLRVAPSGGGGGWMVRHGEEGGAAFRLDTARDSLDVFERNPVARTWNAVRSVPLGMNARDGDVIGVTTTVRGSSVTVVIGGRTVYSGTVNSAAGRVGIRAARFDHFAVDDVVVTSTGGQRLLADTFEGGNPPALSCERWQPLNSPEVSWAPSPCLVAPHDGAKRDRSVGTADLVIANRAFWASSGEYGFARDGLEATRPVVTGQPTMLQDFASWWVWGVRDYYWWSGDRAGTESFYTSVVSTLDGMAALLSPRQLVLDPPGWSHVDWYWSATARSGESTYQSALYAIALERGAELADALGRSEAPRWRARATAIRQAIRAALWDPALGAFVDSADRRDLRPLDGNALAVLAGVVSGDEAARALRHVETSMWSPWGTRPADGPYQSQYHDHTIWPVYVTYEVLARQLLGDGARANEALRRTWGNMLARGPQSTVWELAAPDGTIPDGFDSLAHGWSTGAVWALSSGTLGVEPLAPGFRRIAILPQPGDLPWARGQVPSPAGTVEVHWSADAAQRVVTAALPPGTTGLLGVPVHAGPVNVHLDSTLVWADDRSVALGARRDRHWVVVEVPAGTHTLRATSVAPPPAAMDPPSLPTATDAEPESEEAIEGSAGPDAVATDSQDHVEGPAD